MNYGLDLGLEKQHQSDSDWVFGAFSQPCLASIPEEERESYLPIGEVQRGREDMQDCASRGPINILEAKFTYLLRKRLLFPSNERWLREKGYIEGERVLFSDAFIAIKSDTTRQGNSLKAPVRAIENFGLIPKRLLPLNPEMTWDEYHNPQRIIPEMETLGRQFKQRFTLNYERVAETHYADMLKDDLLSVAGYAWSVPKNGIYPRIEREANHVWVNIKPRFYAFDNYLDTDGDFIKRLAPDYDFYEYGYRIYISKQENVEEQISVIQKALNLLFQLLGFIQTHPNAKPTDEVPEAPTKPVTVPLPPDVPKYDWDTPTLARHSVRVIADEEGLTLEQKNTMCATIGAESGWKPNAIGKANFDGTRDYGICQINPKYWIGPGKQFPSTEYVLSNPEACVRWMCAEWKRGNRNWWYGYKNGSYKSYL